MDVFYKHEMNTRNILIIYYDIECLLDFFHSLTLCITYLYQYFYHNHNQTGLKISIQELFTPSQVNKQ